MAPLKEISHREIVKEPSLRHPPDAGEGYVDPAFGTTILRLTGKSDGQNCHTAYSYWPSFNSDATRITVNCEGLPFLFLFDPDGFRLLGKRALFSRQLPGGGKPAWEDAIWSDYDRQTLFCRSGKSLWSYDTEQSEYALVRDFRDEIANGILFQMSKCAADNVFAFSIRDEDGDTPFSCLAARSRQDFTPW